ncbi:protein SIX6OS1-like isoform X2 [Pseudophryne corroboree]|uniref:protein SIX6OS1-like isoform X2 n=1 Tax=Pseudophryne corroboree TaxID=495146 RepID=UPI0030817CF7
MQLKMDKADFNHFDKLLFELVFQNEQESQNKENINELIQRYSAKILHEKQQILALEKDVSLCDETILDLQKFLAQPSPLSLLHTPTGATLNREVAFLQSQLDNAINTSENDKKTYQDSVCEFKKIFKQHQEKYMILKLAKKYHSLKQELDDIQDVILKHDLQWKEKDKCILDILEPAPFASYIEWSLQLTTLRKNSNDILEQITQISHLTSEIMPKVKELEKKIIYFQEHTENIHTETENNTASQTVEFQQRNLREGETGLRQSNKQPQLLHLPVLPQKLVQPQRDTKLSSYFNESGRKGRDVGIPNKCSSVVSRQDLSAEKDKQATSIYDRNKDHGPATPNLYPQLQLRLVLPEKQTHPKLDAKETEVRKQQTTDVQDTSKDSGYASQTYSGSYEEMECKTYGEVSLPEVFAFPKTPSSFTVTDAPSSASSTFVRKSEIHKGRQGHNFQQSSVDLCLTTMEQTEKSPFLNFFKTSTPKTPNAGSLDSTFGPINFPDQHFSFPGVDTNTSSHFKDIGSIFGKMEADNEFAFPFAPKSPQASDEEKDDFGFMLPFGKELKTPKDSFEPSQSKIKFSFF